MIWFCQKVGVEVEAICCKGVYGYAAGYIYAFVVRRWWEEEVQRACDRFFKLLRRGCELWMKISVWRSVSITGLYWYNGQKCYM